jgi:hypothetical protein
LDAGRVECIGEVSVDTATLVIADPCRLGAQGWDYVERSPNQLPEDSLVVDKHPDPDPSHEAVVVPTGLGDGIYPVFANYVDCGEWGERIMSITIDFTPPHYGPKTVREEKIEEDKHFRQKVS